MGTHLFLVTSSTCVTYLWSHMATPATVIISAFQVVGQKISLSFGSDLSTLLKLLAKVSSMVMENLAMVGPQKGRGMLSYNRAFRWWVTRATNLHSCPYDSFFFGSPHTALSLFWLADMDMDEVVREDMTQAVQMCRKQERKEDKE